VLYQLSYVGNRPTVAGFRVRSGRRGCPSQAVVPVDLLESDEGLQQGDEAMNSYAPGEGSMHRISVECFDVPLRR
jgi:hypothetical protein